MKKFMPETLAELTYVSELSVSPNGKHAAFARYLADPKTNEFVPHVWLLDPAAPGCAAAAAGAGTNAENTGAAAPLDSAIPADPLPACLPFCTDDALYYLADRTGFPQVYRISFAGASGSSPQQVTRLRRGVTGFTVSGNGRLALELPLYPGEEDCFAEEMTREAWAAWKAEAVYEPHVIEDFMYKLDETFGVMDTRQSRIAVQEPDGTARLLSCLSDGKEIRVSLPSWNADGTKLAFYGKPDHGIKAENSEVYVWDGQRITRVTKEQNVTGDTPVCWVNGNPVFPYWKMFDKGGMSEWLMMAVPEDAAGSGTSFRLLPLFTETQPEVCQGISCMPISRSFYGKREAIVRSFSGTLYFRSAWQGHDRLFTLLPDGQGQVHACETGMLNVHDFSVLPDGTILFLSSTPEEPEDVYRFDGALTRLTVSNAFLKDYAPAPIHHEMLAYGGDVWIMEPAGAEPGKKYPAVLDIHGGPECCYVDAFWHEFRALSAAGIAVIWCNPRGGLGYGSAASAPGGWGQEAWDDLLSAVDLACCLPFVDPDRIGVTGGSYGGYMTVKFITRSKRFKAAAAQRALLNTATSYGTGDMGFATSSQPADQVNMEDYLMKRAENSLITRVDEIDTPLLILHGYRDYRCGFEQAEQLFVSVHERHPELPVRLVMFPDENHGVTRTGKPAAQIRHLREMCEWFAKYLKAEVQEDDKK